MDFAAGQGILGRIRFADGNMPEYDRTYLITAATDDYLEVLNVSSIKGKERKLFFPSNERLKIYHPPFAKPSFVKLDSLTKVYKTDWNQLKILCGGRTLDKNEFARILNLLQQ
ncbi:hypothetical protein J6Y50_09645 [bacterium]|nr:hypothetical protein [bacterium]